MDGELNLSSPGKPLPSLGHWRLHLMPQAVFITRGRHERVSENFVTIPQTTPLLGQTSRIILVSS